MSWWAAIASTIAAITGLAALRVGVIETKRRRLTEIIDLMTDIEAAIDAGTSASLRRDELQGRLRTRLGHLDLPKTRELAVTRLHAETAYSELADEALAEVRTALDRVRFRPF